MESKGRQRQVLFDGVQVFPQLFYLPLRVPDPVFDGLDNDDDNIATQPEVPPNPVNMIPIDAINQTQMDEANWDTDSTFDGLCITFVYGQPVIPHFDDESDVTIVMTDAPAYKDPVENQ
jgi:outer membrane protein OmpA-like peptidoglycan-associated protein